MPSKNTMTFRISRTVEDKQFIIGEVLAFTLPLMIAWIIKKVPPQMEDVILATGFSIAFGVLYILGYMKTLIANDQRMYEDFAHVIKDCRSELAKTRDRHIVLGVADEGNRTLSALVELDGPALVFGEHARQKMEAFSRDLQGWRQKVIRLSFEEYAERLGFLCANSSQSIDVVARSEVSRFWEHDWQDTLNKHIGKPVRRVFVIRTIDEFVDGYINIISVHANTYGSECIYITSERALDEIRLTLGYSLPPGMDFGLFDRKVLSRLYSDRAIIIAPDTPGQEQQELLFDHFCRLFDKLVNRSVRLHDVWPTYDRPLTIEMLENAFATKKILFEGSTRIDS